MTSRLNPDKGLIPALLSYPGTLPPATFEALLAADMWRGRARSAAALSRPELTLEHTSVLLADVDGTAPTPFTKSLLRTHARLLGPGPQLEEFIVWADALIGPDRTGERMVNHQSRLASIHAGLTPEQHVYLSSSTNALSVAVYMLGRPKEHRLNLLLRIIELVCADTAAFLRNPSAALIAEIVRNNLVHMRGYSRWHAQRAVLADTSGLLLHSLFAVPVGMGWELTAAEADHVARVVVLPLLEAADLDDLEAGEAFDAQLGFFMARATRKLAPQTLDDLDGHRNASPCLRELVAAERELPPLDATAVLIAIDGTEELIVKFLDQVDIDPRRWPAALDLVSGFNHETTLDAAVTLINGTLTD